MTVSPWLVDGHPFLLSSPGLGNVYYVLIFSGDATHIRLELTLMTLNHLFKDCLIANLGYQLEKIHTLSVDNVIF